MLFQIYDGSQKEINPGSIIKLIPGFLPDYFDNKNLVVSKIEPGYPFVIFFHSVTELVHGAEVQTILINEESAVSSAIILEVSQ